MSLISVKQFHLAGWGVARKDQQSQQVVPKLSPHPVTNHEVCLCNRLEIFVHVRIIMTWIITMLCYDDEKNNYRRIYKSVKILIPTCTQNLPIFTENLQNFRTKWSNHDFKSCKWFAFRVFLKFVVHLLSNCHIYTLFIRYDFFFGHSVLFFFFCWST